MATTTKSKQQTTHTEIARHYVSKKFIDTMFSRGYWYRYSGGVWSIYPDALIEQEIWKLLEAYETAGRIKPTLSIYNTVSRYVRSFLSVEEGKLDAQPHLINLMNGTWNLETGQLLPHDASHYLTSQLPFDYDKNAVSPWWVHYTKTTFVHEYNVKSTDESLVRKVQEAVAYSLTTDISYQVMFWCIGEGANGKGVLFHILDTMGGESSIPLDLNSLNGSARYELATLAGKRIALCSESSHVNNLLEDKTIKQLVGGDKMQVRQIRREPFVLSPQVKLWWSMNRLPTVADTSHGMWRRIEMIPFNKTFGEGDRIRDLKDRLDKELPGIFNWCLDGFARLKSECKFSFCQQSEKMKGDYQFESNTIRLFVDDCCTIDDDKNKGLSDTPTRIYDTYKLWARIMNYKPMSYRSFKQEMTSLRFTYKHSGDRRWEGLQVDDDRCKEYGISPDPWQPAKKQQPTQGKII